MADQLQELIRSLPPCFDGAGAADFTSSIAAQVRDQADENDSWWDRVTDMGEGTTIYSADKVKASANALELYGRSLRDKGGTFCDASFEKNKLITMLGDLYGLMGARIAVNASLDGARTGLAQDIAQNAKDVGGGILNYSKWLIVGLVAAAVIFLIIKYGGK